MSLIWVLIFKSLFTSRWWKVSLKVSWWWRLFFHVGDCLPHPRNQSSYSQMMMSRVSLLISLLRIVVRWLLPCYTIFSWQVEAWIHTVTHRIHGTGILYILITFTIKINHPCRWIYRQRPMDPYWLDPYLEAGYHLTGGLLRLRDGALGRRASKIWGMDSIW